MIQRILLIVILSLFVTSCGGAPAATEAPAVSEVPAETQGFGGVINSATPEPPTKTPTPVPTQTPAATLTETALPPVEIPTQVLNAPARAVWDGVPTYLGDSTPGYSFRVTYDPNLWALTTDQFGFAALAHRNIPGCVISVTSGRGLPPTISVEHDVLHVGDTMFDVGTAFENGVRKSVTYTGGDGNIITAFEVTFGEESDACIADAVTVISTLRSVLSSQATPTLTP